LNIPWLLRDTRRMAARGANNLLNSGFFGVFFAAGWSPCIGTTLGAILTLRVSQDTSGQAMVLASGYALGLSLPFLTLALMLERALGIVARLRRHQQTIQRLSGAFLVLIGLLMLTNRMTWIAIWAQRNGLYLDLGIAGSAPTSAAAVAAGLLSFFSPCVLPLVPAYLGYLSGNELGARGPGPGQWGGLTGKFTPGVRAERAPRTPP